jgi:nucleotide-binding universal stress UspA family protein
MLSQCTKKVLMPIDGSGASNHALDQAIDLIKEAGGRLRLLHVVNYPTLNYGYITEDSRESTIAEICDVGKRIMIEAEAVCRAGGIAAECVVLKSQAASPAELILDQAAEWRATLIVLGAHPGFTAHPGRIGAVVLARAQVPVLCIPVGYQRVPDIAADSGQQPIAVSAAKVLPSCARELGAA